MGLLDQVAGDLGVAGDEGVGDLAAPALDRQGAAGMEGAAGR